MLAKEMKGYSKIIETQSLDERLEILLDKLQKV
jgi:hypothetical protein